MIQYKGWTKQDHIYLLEGLPLFAAKKQWTNLLDFIGKNSSCSTLVRYIERVKAHVGEEVFEYLCGGDKPTAIEIIGKGRGL